MSTTLVIDQNEKMQNFCLFLTLRAKMSKKKKKLMLQYSVIFIKEDSSIVKEGGYSLSFLCLLLLNSISIS